MAIVLVLGVAACSRTDETADTPSDQKITELGVIAQSTRSTLGDDNWVEWDANDSFSVFSSMSFSSEFTIKELLDEGHGAKLEGMTIPADTYYILYPYIMDAMIAEGKIHARNIVPATQPLVENTFDHKQNPAVGHTEGAETVAPMKNIAGLVKVRVTGKIDLRRITLMSNSDNELIAGTGTIDAKTSELTIDESEGSASVTLTASKSIPLTDTPKTFYFVVAPRTFASGFTLTFIGSKEGKNYRFTHTTHNEATITASKILNITKVFDIDITEETVEMEPGITYTADKEIFISDNTFVPAALDSDYDETTKTGRIYFEKGVEVTKVGANAFESTALQTIDLPETIEEIAAGAFKNCAELTEIGNLEKVSAIGTLAFSGCSQLKDITLSPALAAIEDGTFKNCTALTSVDLSGVATIGDTAFENCTALVTVTLSDKTASIGVGAFDGCAGLSVIDIPNSITEISDNVFRDCSKLTEITIPAGVTRIGRTRILRLHGTPHRELQTDDAAERIQRFVPDDLPGDGYQRPGRCIETVSGKHGVEPVLRTVPAFRCALMRRSCTARLGNPPEHAPEKPAFGMRAFSVQAGGITGTGRFRGGSADNGTAPCASRWKPGNSGSRPSRPCRAQRPAAAGSC